MMLELSALAEFRYWFARDNSMTTKTIYLVLQVAMKLFTLFESAALRAALLIAVIYHLWKFVRTL